MNCLSGEIEVLILITKGLINKEIADKLNISLTTVISPPQELLLKNWASSLFPVLPFML